MSGSLLRVVVYVAVQNAVFEIQLLEAIGKRGQHPRCIPLLSKHRDRDPRGDAPRRLPSRDGRKILGLRNRRDDFLDRGLVGNRYFAAMRGIDVVARETLSRVSRTIMLSTHGPRVRGAGFAQRRRNVSTHCTVGTSAAQPPRPPLVGGCRRSHLSSAVLPGYSRGNGLAREGPTKSAKGGGTARLEPCKHSTSPHSGGRPFSFWR